ncbi:hypothetical protein [Paraflavitalea pollutisoli]|uniref:hypothetical protein n=1 Tax=Paraflavitalea pollutisoli TaxID=3034143 RepID=UPI0023EB2AE4|nr:hypothetical protein [Paraflavitalea sp. H1-2-19X]
MRDSKLYGMVLGGRRAFAGLILLIVLLASCTAAKKRKSEKYYVEHKQTITEVRQLFDKLYQHMPFSAGFSDRSLKYFVLEILSDSVRFIYNGEKNQPQLEEAVDRFGFDTTQLRTLATKLQQINCIWISKRSFYVNQQRETVTFLSFKSIANPNLFSENKYYILLFPPKQIISRHFRERIRRGDLVKIEDQVWFTIGSNFR